MRVLIFLPCFTHGGAEKLGATFARYLQAEGHEVEVRGFPSLAFLVILKGLWDGLTTRVGATIDRRLFCDRALQALIFLHTEKKGRIEDEDRFIKGSPAMFESVTSQDPPSDAPILDEPMLDKRNQPTTVDPGWMGKIQHRISKYGLVRGSAASFGALLRRAGQLLDP